MIVMGDFNAQIGKTKNPMETETGTFGIELRNERDDNQVNIGNDHRTVMNNIKLDLEVQRKHLMTKRPVSRCHTNRIMEDRIPT